MDRARSIPSPSVAHPGHRLASTRLATATVALAAAAVGLIAAWLVFGGADEESQGFVAGFAAPAVDLVAAFLILLAARSARVTRIRVAWALIAVGMLVYAAGDAIWTWIAVVEQADPFPSAADVAYVGFYPMLVGALLLFPVPSRARREAVRLAVDSAIVVLGGGMLVWHSLFAPALAAVEPDAIRTALTLGYPVGDLVLLFGVATIAMRRPEGIAPRALVALVSGLALMFVADVAYGELALTDTPQEHWIDLVYLTSSLAVAAAGYLQIRSAGSAAEDEARGLTRWQMALPYAGLAGGFGVLLAAADGNVSGSFGELFKGAVGLTVLVLVRQELTSRENARLLADGVRRESEARYRSLGGQATDVVLLVGADGVIAYTSSSLERVLGLESEAILGKKVTSLAHADDTAALRGLVAETVAGRPVAPLEWRLWARDGVWRQVETVSANLLDDPTIGKIVLTTRDVRERKALRQELTQTAFHDLLTGLPNRALFMDRVGQALASARRNGTPTSILKLDIDGFTRLNASLGPATGDLALVEVARRLSLSVRAADTAARVGGDEFAVLLDGTATADDALDVAERFRASLREPMSLAGAMIELTADIGIATGDEAGEGIDPTVLTRNAQVALSVAREVGVDQVVVFAPSMQRELEARFELESDLRKAIARQELVLHYQPIVDLATREIVGAEALVRWDHPTRGRLGPDVFIPVAEETGLIAEIGTWVLRTACLEVARWASQAPNRVPRVSVNLASAQVADPNLPWAVQSALAQAGAAPGWLTLELTERQLVQDTADVLERLHAIRALGVQISVDDFGTGYSSLAYLQQFPVSHIKIDRSFVTPLDDPERGSGVAAAIVEIGRALGMSTIAEGIETERQLERLQAMGCPLGQGFLLGRPLESGAILELIAGSTHAPVLNAA
jgi:diguanylate cyclase (GGDEF)-like protein/PAS domain S-box-containing protein